MDGLYCKSISGYLLIFSYDCHTVLIFCIVSGVLLLRVLFITLNLNSMRQSYILLFCTDKDYRQRLQFLNDACLVVFTSFYLLTQGTGS